MKRYWHRRITFTCLESVRVCCSSYCLVFHSGRHISNLHFNVNLTSSQTSVAAVAYTNSAYCTMRPSRNVRTIDKYTEWLTKFTAAQTMKYTTDWRLLVPQKNY